MLRRTLVVAALVLAAFSLAVVVSQTSATLAQERARPGRSEGLVLSTERFAFFSHPAVDLHHHLIGLIDQRSPAKSFDTAGWREAERAALEEASSFYSEAFAGRSVVLDHELIVVRDLLTLHPARLPAEPPPDALGSPRTKVARAIEAVWAALPGYLAHEFPAVDSRNRRWARELEPLVTEHELALTAELERVWDGSWPEQPLAVDLVTWGGSVGAYTTSRGPVTISTADELVNHRAVESLIHEASHTGRFERPLRAAVTAAFRNEGVAEPRDAWHVALFVGAGEIMRRHLAERGVEGYVTYAETGLWERNRRWSAMNDALAPPFRRFLAGEIDRQTALRAGVRAHASASP